MQRYQYTTTGYNDEQITGTYVIWPNGTGRKEIEYTFPDGDPPRWTRNSVRQINSNPYYPLWQGQVDARTHLHHAIIDAIRATEGLPPSIVHPDQPAEPRPIAAA